MTKITNDEVKKVAHLARLELNEDEINHHAEQLEKILEYKGSKVFKLSKNNIIWLREEFIKKNIWVRPLKNIIYFMPPFIINKKQRSTKIEENKWLFIKNFKN